MAMIYCSQCGARYSDDADKCIKCGATNGIIPTKKQNKGTVKIILIVIGALLFVGMFASDDSAQNVIDSKSQTNTIENATKNPITSLADTMMRDIEKSVALDAIEMYEIAKRQGDPIQTCVQAGLVSAALLQAKDEKNYKKWKDIEKKECRAAGMPF